MSGFEMQTWILSWQGDTSQETTLNTGPAPLSIDIIITVSSGGNILGEKRLSVIQEI